MKNNLHFEAYIHAIFAEYPSTRSLEAYKNDLLYRMEKRAAEIRLAGMQDEKVLYDLVVSLYANAKEEYDSILLLHYKNRQNRFQRAGV